MKYAILIIVFGLSLNKTIGQNCTGSVVPPTTVNGINVTSSFTGSSILYPYGAWNSCTFTTPPNAIWVGQNGAFTHTFNFSTTINHLYIVMSATGELVDEVFTFTTNNGTPNISDQGSCALTSIVGNVLTTGAVGAVNSGANSGGGGGEYIISTCNGFTSLTISGPGGQNGSIIALCQNSVNNNGPNLIGNDTTICANTFVPFTKTSPNYASYQWEDDQGNILSNMQSYTILDSGTYILSTVGGPNQCNDLDTLNVTFHPTNTTDAGADITFSCYTPANPTFTANGNGSHSWETPSGSIINSSTMPLTPGIEAGNYILSTTDINNCIATDTATLYVDTIIPNVNAGEDTVLTCVNSVISLQGNNLGPSYTYNWTTNNGNIQSGNNSSSCIIDENGEYYLTITNNDNGCTSHIDSILVDIDTLKPTSIAGQDTSFSCIPPTISLNGLQSNQGTDFQANWTTLNGSIISNGTTLTPTINSGGIYTLTITNINNGCISSSIVNVVQDDTAEVSILLNNIETNLADITSLENQTFSYIGTDGVIIWTLDNDEISTDSLFDYSFNESSTVYIELTNNTNGCKAYDSISLNIVYKFVIPDAISPDNGDGLNDYFIIKALENFDNNSLVIFNRWGNSVFEASPYLNDWKGQSNTSGILSGADVADGTYFYILKLIKEMKSLFIKDILRLRESNKN